MSEKSLGPMVSDGNLEIVRKRIVKFLPGMGKVPVGTQLALAYVTLAYGLDPFMGDVWPIPQRYKGKVVGYRLMFGITARRKVAHRSGEYNGCNFRWLTEDEAQLLGVDLKKGWKGIACHVWRRGITHAFVGFGVVSPSDPSKMNHGQLAKLRAERAALKMAFPVELPGVVEAMGGLEVDVDATDQEIVEGELVQEEDESDGEGGSENSRSVGGRRRATHPSPDQGPLSDIVRTFKVLPKKDEGGGQGDEKKPRSARQNELELYGPEEGA